LGRTHNVPANLMIIDGEYDVVYDHVDGETIPQNDGAVLPDSVVVDEADEAANIDVDSVTVQGNFMLDGDSFSQSVYHTADFQLYRNGGGAPILLGKTYTETEPVVILAGNYDVVYEHIDGDLVPQNLHHVMLAGQAYTADTTIDVNALTRSACTAVIQMTMSFSVRVLLRSKRPWSSMTTTMPFTVSFRGRSFHGTPKLLWGKCRSTSLRTCVQEGSPLPPGRKSTQIRMTGAEMKKGPTRGPFIHIGSGGVICTVPTVPKRTRLK